MSDVPEELMLGEEMLDRGRFHNGLAVANDANATQVAVWCRPAGLRNDAREAERWIDEIRTRLRDLSEHKHAALRCQRHRGILELPLVLAVQRIAQRVPHEACHLDRAEQRQREYAAFVDGALAAQVFFLPDRDLQHVAGFEDQGRGRCLCLGRRGSWKPDEEAAEQDRR